MRKEDLHRTESQSLTLGGPCLCMSRNGSSGSLTAVTEELVVVPGSRRR